MQHHHTLSHQQQQQLLQLHHQAQQQQPQHMQPHVRPHHSGGFPGYTMTVNRKVIDKNTYSEDNPPPLPPLRNPQKALDPVQAIPSLNDSSVNERDKQIYICSALKNPNSHSVNNSANTSHYGTMKSSNSSSRDQTTFNSTSVVTTKPFPSIINTPLPEIPQQQIAPPPKDDIYVKRKSIDQNSKFATLKAIPLPKIEALEIDAQKKKMAQAQQQQQTAVESVNLATVSAADSPLPPPPVVNVTNSMTTSQIQSLPLPPPPPELIAEDVLPSPPLLDRQSESELTVREDSNNFTAAKSGGSKEVIYATKAITNNHGNCEHKNGSIINSMGNGNGDQSSFYAVTEL